MKKVRQTERMASKKERSRIESAAASRIQWITKGYLQRRRFQVRPRSSSKVTYRHHAASSHERDIEHGQDNRIENDHDGELKAYIFFLHMRINCCSPGRWVRCVSCKTWQEIRYSRQWWRSDHPVPQHGCRYSMARQSWTWCASKHNDVQRVSYPLSTSSTHCASSMPVAWE